MICFEEMYFAAGKLFIVDRLFRACWSKLLASEGQVSTDKWDEPVIGHMINVMRTYLLGSVTRIGKKRHNCC